MFMSLNSFSQICGEQFIDSGGIDGVYANNEDYTVTICPEVDGDVVSISFLSFDIEACCDSLTIYNGDDVTDDVLGIFQGTDIPPLLTSTNETGCLTFVFHSDGSVVYDGWVADIFCTPPPTCEIVSDIEITNISDEGATISWTDNNDNPEPLNDWRVEIVPEGTTPTGIGVSATNPYIITGLNDLTNYEVYVSAICDDGGLEDPSFWVTSTFNTLLTPLACGDQFMDSGGIYGTYENGEDITTTICPEISENVTVYFFSFDIEFSHDTLSIYDGDSVTAPLLGVFSGTNLPPTFTSTHETGCLTFVFHSDATEKRDGWIANVICGPLPTCLEVSDFVISNVETNTAQISWTDNNTPLATEWELEIVPSGVAPTGNGVSINTNLYTITGLNPLITYNVYVRSNCGSEGLSFWSWSNPISFTTLNYQPIDYPYLVEPIPFKIYGETLENTYYGGDDYSNFIPLNFNFNYFGYTYNQVIIGENSVISFDATDLNAWCPWQINEEDIIPNVNVIDNAILGTYQDYFNISGVGAQVYGFIGTAPFRKFVLFFDDVALFGCNTITSSNQTIIYETYNFIDVQVKDRNVCETWNGGRAILGIQSIDGTYAYFPENRNTGDWEAHNEGWRFRPEQDHPEYQYIVCDNNENETEVFDLNVIINHFDDGTGNQYSLFISQIDAENNVNEIITTNYVNTSNTQTLYLREFDGATVTVKNILLAVINCTEDYDLDNVPTSEEDLNANGNYGDDDTDGDAIPDFIDEDDDGDYVLTNVEAVNTRNPEDGYLDTDGDLIPDYLDNDDDGDGILTLDEDLNGNYILTDDDSDGDNIPDYLDNHSLSVTENLLNSFEIYPNPVKNILTLELASLQTNVSFTIYNLSGSLLYKRKTIQNLKTAINISTLSSGVYFIKLENEHQNVIRKFVKE